MLVEEDEKVVAEEIGRHRFPQRGRLWCGSGLVEHLLLHLSAAVEVPGERGEVMVLAEVGSKGKIWGKGTGRRSECSAEGTSGPSRLLWPVVWGSDGAFGRSCPPGTRIYGGSSCRTSS